MCGMNKKVKNTFIETGQIAERLKQLRLSKKLSREELARTLNVSTSLVCKWEYAQRGVSDEDKVALAKFYNMTVQELFFND